jgi:hypothetical protein
MLPLVLLAVLLAVGCQQDGPPLEPLGDAPSTSTATSTSKAPTSTGRPTPGASNANTALACEVGRIMTDTTAAALQHSSDAAALAKLYGDAATKIRTVAARAAGTPLAQTITKVAVAVDGIARHFATGSLQPPDSTALTKAFDELPLCR